ncbi:helix-turn-helix transcriptional regulator [bacterium]|nr:helix-turn-helix transcriptional regulator [bacterium]
MIKVITFKLKELLKKEGYEGWSYRKLAKEIGVSHLPIWKMLNNAPYNPSLEMLDKLCSFLKVQPGDLLKHQK